MMRPSSAQAGFSLAETLVALFILALVSSAGATLLIGATGAGKQVRDREAEAREIDIAQRLIRQDIAAMSIRAVDPADGFSPPGSLFGERPRSDAPFLRFVRGGWINPAQIEPRSSLQAVAYALRDGKLVREVTLRPDATNATPRVSRVLLDNVRSIEVGFIRGGDRSEFWQGDAIQAREILPDLIEIAVTFENETTLKLAALTGGRS
ncbi:MAG: type II secretion system minor pseudopilin GspJ [Hyphomonadaceae bacterium]|nr:type II secretion system minor pseudopilin GspJ [Hyphomonadaceae bacterium]